jgi:hypothetical protein
MGRDSVVLTLGRCSFHHWGDRTEKSFDWAEWELISRRGGSAKRPEVAEESVRNVGFEHTVSPEGKDGQFPLLLCINMICL